MGYEQQHIDEECEQAEEEVNDSNNEENKKVSG